MCRGDFMRRWVLFKYLVKNVIGYGRDLKLRGKRRGKDDVRLY